MEQTLTGKTPQLFYHISVFIFIGLFTSFLLEREKSPSPFFKIMNWEKDYLILKNGFNAIDKIIEKHQKYFNEKDLSEYSFEEIIALSLMLRSPQGRTALYEKKLSQLLNWKKIPASKEMGDYFDDNKNNFELKISSTNQDECINVDQIRLWQNVDYYLLCFINIETLSLISFKLTKEQMEEETKKFGSACHGTKKANEDNSKIEYSFRIPINSKNERYQYFYENYLYKII